MRRLLRKILLWWWRLLALAALTLTLILGINAWFVGKTVDRINKADANCASLDVGILFGTSQYLRSGLPNPHYYGRINEAARLYSEGKIQHLLVSGDNRTRYYNEPKRMQQDLMNRGLPEESMSLDHAGFSTFDTLKRAQQVFNVERALLITQDYHLPRALFIADSLGIEAYGCQAAGPHWKDMKNILLREVAARMRTLGDLYIWKREPRLLDDPQPLEF